MLYRTPKEEFEPLPEFNNHPKEIEAAVVMFSMILVYVICLSIG